MRLLPFTIPRPRSTDKLHTLSDFLVDAVAAHSAIRPEIKVIGAVARVGGGQLNPAAGELDVTAR